MQQFDGVHRTASMLMLNVLPVHNISLVYAIVWSIENSYAKYSAVPLSISQFSKTSESRSYHNDLMDAVMRQATARDSYISFLLENEENDVQKKTIKDDKTSTSSGLYGRQSAIWFLDSLKAFRFLERHMLRGHNIYARNGYFCIVYTGMERARLEIIREIFKRLFAIYMINVNVFLTIRDNVHLYTYFPYKPNKCQASLPMHFASFQGVRTSNFSLDKPFFPAKLDNMHGCELVVSTFEQPPYVVIATDPNDPSRKLLYGIEGVLFGLLAEKINFTVRVLVDPNRDRGVVYPNGTTTGAIKKVTDGEANVTFVCFMYSKDRTDVMLPTISYISFPIVLCIPAGKPMSSFERIRKPFRYIIWSCVITSLTLGLCLICLLQMCGSTWLRHFVFGATNWQPCMNTWAIFFAGMATHPPRGTFARYLLLLWLVYTLVMRTAYTGELYILLQDGRLRTTLETLAEAIALDYTFFMLPALEVIFRAIMPNIRIAVVTNGEAGMQQLLRRFRDDAADNIALVIPRPSVAQFDALQEPGSRMLTVLPEQLMTAPITIYLRPHSYLKRRFDDLLMAMISSGIVDRYREMYMERNRPHKTILRPLALNVWRLSGVFILYASMQLLACIVFGLELWAVRRPRLRLLLDMVNRYMA